MSSQISVRASLPQCMLGGLCKTLCLQGGLYQSGGD